MEAIAEHCPNLERYSSSWCPHVSSPGIAALLASCLRLSRLNLTGLKKLTDEAFTSLLTSETTSVTLLNLEMCDFVTDSLLLRLKVRHPYVTIYNYYKDEITLP